MKATHGEALTGVALFATVTLVFGVVVRPSAPGALAVAALAVAAAVFRRQESEDTSTAQTVSSRLRLEEAFEAIDLLDSRRLGLDHAHQELRAEFDKVKLMVPRPPNR